MYLNVTDTRINLTKEIRYATNTGLKEAVVAADLLQGKTFEEAVGRFHTDEPVVIERSNPRMKSAFELALTMVEEKYSFETAEMLRSLARE